MRNDVLASSEMGKGVGGQRPPRWRGFVVVHVRCRWRSLSFAHVFVLARWRPGPLSFALVVVRARCRSRSLSFALIVVRVRYVRVRRRSCSLSSVVCFSTEW